MAARPSPSASPALPERTDEEEAAIGESLCALAAKGDVQAMQAALTNLEPGAFASYLNRTGPHHRTPLHAAAQANQQEMVNFILSHGASVNPINDEDRTPLELAERAGHDEVVAVLRSKGGYVASIQRLEQIGRLIHAAAKGDLDAVTAEIGKGADPASTDYDMRTPLHLACSEGRMRVTSYLVHLGVPLSPVDRFGGTPLKYAKQYGHWDIARFLEKRGASDGEKDKVRVPLA